MKHNDLVIPVEKGTDPFENCKLDRRQYADVLTSIVSSYADGFVLAINNKWGTGKTTFVKMWRQDLKNNGYQTLYFNAWENDFQPEVIVAFLGELSELRKGNEKTFKVVMQKGATLINKVVPAVVKGVASTVVGDETVKEIIGAVTEFTAKELESEIQKFNENKKSIEDFRKALENFVNKIENEKPVVFIIDELDRCRPNYAVSILEEIKHLFSVPGIVFVLSIDKEQLGHAVRGVYGSDLINADEYLRRFIDVEFQIPKPKTSLIINYFNDYYNFKKFFGEDVKVRNRDYSQNQDDTIFLSNVFFEEFSLRELEKVFARIGLVLTTYSKFSTMQFDVLIFLSFLFEKYRSEFDSIQLTLYNPQQFVEFLDNILLPFQTVQNRRKIIDLYASILHKYYNQFMTLNRSYPKDLIEYDSTKGKNILNIKSSIDEDTLVASLSKYSYALTELTDMQRKFCLIEKIQNE